MTCLIGACRRDVEYTKWSGVLESGVCKVYPVTYIHILDTTTPTQDTQTKFAIGMGMDNGVSLWEEGRGQGGVTCTQTYMGRGEGPRRGHMHTDLHGKRGGTKEGSQAHRPTGEEGRGQRGVTCTDLHGKRGGAKEGSHVHRPTWEEGRGPKRGHMHTDQLYTYIQIRSHIYNYGHNTATVV